MIKIYTFIAALFVSTLTFAQAPEKMSFQAVVRNASNELIKNQTVGMQISILQGSASGNAVYTETQTPECNSNGLASIEIGTGTTTDDFSAITWENGPFFIKTETDPNGGTNYTITGTTQLLSVPYALYAKSAGSVEGVLNISTQDTANWNNDNVLDSTNIANLGYVAGPHNQKYSVGDTALGGVVFWVDESGQHGLVISPTQLSSGLSWYTGVSGNTLGRGEGLFAGEMNTLFAVVLYGEDNATYPDTAKYAARICADLSETQGGVVYGGWYLPSKEELSMIQKNRNAINPSISSLGGQQVSSSFYWSSTETTDGKVWGQNMSSGLQLEKSKASTYSVRAIRKF